MRQIFALFALTILMLSLQAKDLVIDSSSKIGFKVSKFGFLSVEGEFR